MTAPLPAAVAALVEQVDPVTLAVAVSVLPELHPLAVAARAGLDVAELSRDYRRAMRDASHAVAAGMLDERRRWSGEYGVPHAEIVRRRTLPGPLARPIGGVA